MISKCPISDYPIKTKKEWSLSVPNEDYLIEVSIIGHNILHLKNRGYNSFVTTLAIHPQIVEIINTEFSNTPYYIVYNYESFKGISIKARNYHINWVKENENQIKGIFFYGVSPFSKILIKTSHLILRKKFYLLQNYEEVITKILQVDNPSLSHVDSEISFDRQKKYCSLTGYEIKAPDSWVFKADNGKYGIEISIIDDNIFHVKNIGYATIEITKRVWPLIFSIYNSEIKGKPFYLIHDYSDYLGASSEVRRNYAKWVQERSKEILGLYVYAVSPITHILLKAGRLLVKDIANVYILKSYKEAILSINEHNRKKTLSQTIVTAVEEDWLIGSTLIELKKKYVITKQWFHTYNSARIRTYLINDNIIVRKYFGIFTEEISEDTKKDLVTIFNECDANQFHFYTQFDFSAKVSVKYRKYAVAWFNENFDQLLTVGFFNLSFVNRVAVNIARTFSYQKSFKDRIFVLNKLEDVFKTVELFSLGRKPKEYLKERYQSKTKEELIDLLISIQKEKDDILQNQNKEIVSLYNKLGRLSWDEDYNFDENNIDTRDTPFSDLNNAIHLIQEDVKELLLKRDAMLTKAKESDRLKSAFLANMSHEIRTPLNSILGFSDLLKDSPCDEDTTRQYASIIVENGNNLLSLINDIIDISKIESEQLTIVKEPFPIGKLIRKIFQSFDSSKELQEKKLNLILDNQIPEGLNIISDKLRIQQILNNLLNNAVKFTEKGQIKIITNYQNRFLSITVEDTGVGIDEEKQLIIFERFRQEDNDTTHFYGGSGLGLSISRSLAQLLGGDIFLSSEKGKGSVFELKIPSGYENVKIKSP